MYRCVALLATASPSSDPAVLAREAQIEFGPGRVVLDGRDVTEAIRAPAISEAASRVAADPRVREVIVAKQRGLIAQGDWVVEGRDIGTVVAPDADVKVFLTACPRERARRRARQLGADPEQVLAEQLTRDERDSTRADSPLRPAPGAVTLDSSDLRLDAVVSRIAELARAAASSE
jgi:cytidylate kinase